MSTTERLLDWLSNGVITEVVLVLYALGLMFFVWDLARSNKRAKRSGTGLLILAWVWMSLIVLGLLWSGDGSWGHSANITMLLYIWILLTIVLIVSRLAKRDATIYFVAAIGFILLFLAWITPTNNTNLQDEITSSWIWWHVSLALIGYVAFTYAAACSFCYLILHVQLKEKRWAAWSRRMPSLEMLEKSFYTATLFGLPLFTFSIWLGWNGISGLGETVPWKDPKIVQSILIILAYIGVLLQRWVGKQSALMQSYGQLIAFVFVILNFLLSDMISRFHPWGF